MEVIDYTDAFAIPGSARPVSSACDGRFELLRKLGEGGMGIVHLARDTRSDELVAVKVLSNSAHDNLYRFKREFRSLSGVAHPNLVHLRELIACQGTWHLVMDYIDGRDLITSLCGPPCSSAIRDLPTQPLGAAPPLPAARERAICDEPRLREAFGQLAEAIHALHASGFLHKDIKPANVIVEPGGRVVLLDFGMVADRWARPERATLDDRVFGTPAYMAPEQVAGAPTTPASDWYSFGVVLYEALTGRLPFEGSVLDMLVCKQEGDPPCPSDVCPGVSADLDALCMQLLACDPAGRPPGAEIVRRLGAASVPSPSTAPALIPFFGRAPERRRLRRAFETARKGRPLAVRVEGEPGVGKSSLGGWLVDELRGTPGVVVLEGRCCERETIPMRGVDMLVDSLGRYLKGLSRERLAALLPDDVCVLAGAFPVLRKVDVIGETCLPYVEGDHAWSPRAAAEVLEEVLARIACEKTLVLWIDDMHHSDRESAHVFASLLARDAGLSLFIGVACEAGRSDPLSEALRGLRPPRRAVPVRLSGLDEVAAEALARRALGPGHLSATVRDLVRASKGKPGELLELVRDRGGTFGAGGAPGDFCVSEVLAGA